MQQRNEKQTTCCKNMSFLLKHSQKRGMCGVTRKDRLHNEHIKRKLTDSSNKGENQRMMFEMIWAYTQKTKTNPVTVRQ